MQTSSHLNNYTIHKICAAFIHSPFWDSHFNTSHWTIMRSTLIRQKLLSGI